MVRQLISWMVGGRQLTAAGALLLVAGTLMPACSQMPTNDPQPGGDQATARRIYARLYADPTYYYRHVDVSVNSGIATLSGYVWSAKAIYHAQKITARVPGVRKVITTDLELEREAGTGPAGS